MTVCPKLNVTNPSKWVWDTCTVLGKVAAEKKSMPIGYGHALRVMQDTEDEVGNRKSGTMKAMTRVQYSLAPLRLKHPLSQIDTPFTQTDFLAALQLIGTPRPSSEDDPDAIVQRVDYCSDVYNFCLAYFGEAGSGVYTKFVTDYDKWWEASSRELLKE